MTVGRQFSVLGVAAFLLIASLGPASAQSVSSGTRVEQVDEFRDAGRRRFRVRPDVRVRNRRRATAH